MPFNLVRPFADRAVWLHDSVGYLDHFLSSEEVSFVESELRYAYWRPSPTYEALPDGTRRDVVNSFRTSESTYYHWFTPGLSEFLAGVDGRISTAFGFDADCLEPWQGTRYKPGGVFEFHRDSGYWSDLVPTYSYLRLNRPGDRLPAHRDRPACEVTVSTSLTDDARWPLRLLVGGRALALCPSARGAVAFRGHELLHWREPLIGSEPAAHVLFHYVVRHGACRSWAYDRRPCAPPGQETAPCWVTFEGLDGAGKSSLMREVAAGLRSRLCDQVLHLPDISRSPTGHRLGDVFRADELFGPGSVGSTVVSRCLAAAADLFYFDGALIAPVVAAGGVVLKERHVDTLISHEGPVLARQCGWSEEQAYGWLSAVTAALQVRPALTVMVEAPSGDRERRLRERVKRRGAEPGRADAEIDREVFRVRAEWYERLRLATRDRWISVANPDGGLSRATARAMAAILERHAGGRSAVPDVRGVSA